MSNAIVGGDRGRLCLTLWWGRGKRRETVPNAMVGWGGRPRETVSNAIVGGGGDRGRLCLTL